MKQVDRDRVVLRPAPPLGWSRTNTGQAVIVVCALVAGLGAAWLALRSSREASPAIAALFALVVGWSFVASGLAAWRQRPDNRLGTVMVAIGFAWFATYLRESNTSLVFSLGRTLESVYLVGFVYLVLSFPNGRLSTRLDRALAASAVLLAFVLQVVLLAFDSPELDCRGCPANALEVTPQHRIAEVLLGFQRGVGLALSLLTVVLLIERWRRASPAGRQRVAPVLWAGSGIFLALAFSVANDAAGHPLADAPRWTLYCALAAFPITVLAVLVRRRLARGAVAGLVVELGESAMPIDLRAALARALADPSLAVGYWVPAHSRYVDSAGQPMALPESLERAVTLVKRSHQPIAALIHDPAVSDDPALIDSICAAAGLALENERLRVDLRARLTELEASRSRLAEAAEQERRRLERDLHDGAQQRLVSIAMSVGLAESLLASDPEATRVVLERARGDLTQALRELRELSQGLHPGILAERGLPAALEELRRSVPLPVVLDMELPRRLPARLETAAYFVVCEALTNVSKHASARRAVVGARIEAGRLIVRVADDGVGGVDLDRGSGLRGLEDRVAAAGGVLRISAGRDGGTLLEAEFRCVS